MNKTTLKNLEKYVKKNALRFIDCSTDCLELVYKYKELKIGVWSSSDGESGYFIKICEKNIEDTMPLGFTAGLFGIIKLQKAKTKQKIQEQSYNNFIKKINKDAK